MQIIATFSALFAADTKPPMGNLDQDLMIRLTEHYTFEVESQASFADMFYYYTLHI